MATESLEGPSGCSRVAPLRASHDGETLSFRATGQASGAQETRPLQFYSVGAHSRVSSHMRPVVTTRDSPEGGRY